MLTVLRVRLKGWRTILINAALGVPAALYGIYLQFGTIDFTPVIPAKYVSWFTIGWAILGIILRIITTGRVGEKDHEDRRD